MSAAQSTFHAEIDEIRLIREGLVRIGANRRFAIDVATRPPEERALALNSLGVTLDDLRAYCEPDVHFECAGMRVMEALSDLIEGNVEAAQSPSETADWRARAPRYYSGVDEIDAHSGLYGITAFGGGAGAGKSLLAASTAVVTALQRPKRGGLPPRVFYVAAEMDSGEVIGRLMRVADGEAGKLLGVNLHPILTFDSPKSPLRFSDILRSIWRRIEVPDELVLVAIDSVNTLADQLGGDYWKALAAIEGSLITLRRLTGGYFAALILSELNKAGELKGRKVEYAADLVFRCNPGPGGDDVEIECVKGRSGGRRKYGTYRIDWQRGAFAPVAAQVEDRNRRVLF